MTSKPFSAGLVTAVAAGSVLAAGPAGAATLADCGTHTGATVTLINGSICNVVFSTAGEYTFKAPAGVTALSALVIGAGAGAIRETFGYPVDSFVGYAGGGGEVVYVSTLDSLATHDVVVGEGGSTQADMEDRSGGFSQLNGEADFKAEGGLGSWFIGSQGLTDSPEGWSGSGKAGFSDSSDNVRGGGAKSDASATAPGEGYFSSDVLLTGGSSLFPVFAEDFELGRGGTAEAELPERKIGWGGSSNLDSDQEGADGGVIFRFLAVSSAGNAQLAETGSKLTVMPALIAGVAVLLGTGMVVVSGLGRAKTRVASHRRNSA